MLEASARNVLFFDVLLTPHHPDIEHIPLDGILRSLEDSTKQEAYVKLIENEQAAVRLNDVQVDLINNTATLLITYADKRGADPVFANLEKGTLRSEPKLEGEGVAISAHIVFNLNRNPQSGLYSAIIEDVPGVGRTILEPFLRSAFKNCSSYLFKNKNGNEQKTWPAITFLITQSEPLARSLNKGGKVVDVEVTKFSVVGGFDTIPNVIEKKTTTTLKVAGRPTGVAAEQILNTIMTWANRKGYVDMRVHWINSGKERKQVALGTARADIADVLYGRVERVVADDKLPQCCETINVGFNKKMLALLK